MEVLVTPRSFGKNDSTPLKLLKKHGIEIVANSTGGIMSEAQIKDAIADCEGIIVGVDLLNAAVISAASKTARYSKIRRGSR